MRQETDKKKVPMSRVELRISAEEKARQERVARLKAEKEAKARADMLEKKRKLAWHKAEIKNSYFKELIASSDWNSEYADYLATIDTKDYANMSIEELSAPVLTREEFENEQKKILQETVSDKVYLIWKDVLNNVSASEHRWKYDYMEYLEGIRFREIEDLTLKEIKELILSLDEFEQLKEKEYQREQKKKAELQIAEVENIIFSECEDIVEKVEPLQNDEIVANVNSSIDEDDVLGTVEVHRPLTMEERSEQIVEAIRGLHVPYDDISAKKKAELYQFTVIDVDYDLKLDSMVLSQLGLSGMYGAEVFDDYREIVDVTDKSKNVKKKDYLITTRCRKK